jgi:hypothetical protein
MREPTMRRFYLSRTSIRAIIVGGLVAAFFALTASPSSAIDAASPAQPGAAKPAQSSYKPYFVEFRARSAASYGHLYVLYGQLNGRGEIVKSDIAGLHPAGDANDCENCSLLAWTLGHLVFVPSEIGASDGDLEEKYVTARYRVMVDAATYKKLSAYISQKKADKPMWHALINSCITFGNGVAENLGLKTPSSNFMEPKEYVETLRDLNGGKPQKGLRFAAPSSGSAESAKPVTPAVPSKPKKPPVADLPATQDVAGASGTTR